MIPDNACTLRITAAAGTELAGAYSDGTLKPRARRGYCSHPKEVYNAERLRPSRGMAGSGFRHCPIFLTAASRRSRVRVSVPVWGAMLSHPLSIVALVGRYPAN